MSQDTVKKHNTTIYSSIMNNHKTDNDRKQSNITNTRYREPTVIIIVIVIKHLQSF